MTNEEFIKKIAMRSCVATDEIVDVLDALGHLVLDELKSGRSITIPKLGTFSLTRRKARMGKNLIGGKNKSLPECIYPTFTISNYIKSKCKSENHSKNAPFYF